MAHHLTCKVLKIEGGKVNLEIEGQVLSLEKDLLPDYILEQEKYHIYLYDYKNGCKEKVLAKEILEEILNGK